MSEFLLSVDQVTSGYGAVEALHEVSLNVQKGEIVSIIGANGAGKTSLLMTIFGNPRLRSGDIKFQGQSISAIATHKIASLGIALVPEGRRIFPAMTVEENLMVGTIARAEQKADFGKDFAYVYELFPILLERKDQRAGTLSGGQQQMLAIGRGLMAKPTLLLLDEPSLGLAPKIVQQIFSILKTIARDGITILLVEQNANHALKLSSRGYVLVNGVVQLSGSGEELLANPEVKNAYLGGH